MLKKIVSLANLSLVCFSSLAYAWTIEDYKVDLILEKDSSFVITEAIRTDFGYEEKHGIFRDIPTAYSDEGGNPYNIQFEILDVTDENNDSQDYKVEEGGNFLRIKIGSPYRTLSGEQTYIISYRVTGAILFHDEYDELYWIAVGPNWDVPINHVAIALHLPQPISRELLKTASFTGPRGSKTSNATSEIVSSSLITFEGRNYAPYDAFTIAVGIPKGILTKPPVMAERVDQSFHNSYQGSPAPGYSRPFGKVALVLPFFVFFIMWNIWKRFGKDPQLNKSIVVEYKAPDDLKPAEIGTLIDGRVDQRDITAAVIDLAIRGYLKIVQKKGLLFSKEYTFVRLKDFETDQTVRFYERAILRSIFETKNETSLSELQDNFYRHVDVIEREIKEQLEPKNYLTKNPQMIVAFYTILAFMIFSIGLFTAMFDLWLMSALVLSSCIIVLFGLVMPKRTVEGADIQGKILGFKEFLQRTEKDKIERADREAVFERMLPYAIALGMSTKWATTFDGLYAGPPEWFAGDYGNVFVYDHFIHDLDRSIDSMGTTFIPRRKRSAPEAVFPAGAADLAVADQVAEDLAAGAADLGNN